MRHLFCECVAARSAMNKINQAPGAGQTHMGLLDATINDMLLQTSVTKRNAIRLLCFSLAVWRTRGQFVESKSSPETICACAATKIKDSYFKIFKSRTTFKKKATREEDKRQLDTLMLSLPPGIDIYTDGSSLTNPGPAGAGIYVKSALNIQPIFKSVSLGEASNNDAELCALHEATQIIENKIHLAPAHTPVYVFIDSTTTIKVGLGYTRSTSMPVKANATAINLRRIALHNPIYLIWCPAHIGIIGNEVADFLAKRGAAGVSSMECPPQDFLNSVNFDDAVT